MEVRGTGVFVETHRVNGPLSGCMWLADSDLPEHLRAPGCRFELTFIPHLNGTCSMHIVPLKRIALHPGTEVVYLTLITMLCAQALIELAITRHEEPHAPWVALTWLFTLLIVIGLRWTRTSSLSFVGATDDCP